MRITLALVPAVALSLVSCSHSQPVPPSPATQQQVQTINRNPINARAWITLGNKYFDEHQRQKAIDAYGRALQLEPDNPDVLTDQGVMYRELGAYDKAIANFERANAIDPKHLPSLLDLGVLYAQDLKDEEKAINAWTRLIRIAPTSIQAARAQAYIDQIRTITKPN